MREAHRRHTGRPHRPPPYGEAAPPSCGEAVPGPRPPSPCPPPRRGRAGVSQKVFPHPAPTATRVTRVADARPGRRPRVALPHCASAGPPDASRRTDIGQGSARVGTPSPPPRRASRRPWWVCTRRPRRSAGGGPVRASASARPPSASGICAGRAGPAAPGRADRSGRRDEGGRAARRADAHHTPHDVLGRKRPAREGPMTTAASVPAPASAGTSVRGEGPRKGFGRDGQPVRGRPAAGPQPVRAGSPPVRSRSAPGSAVGPRPGPQPVRAGSAPAQEAPPPRNATERPGVPRRADGSCTRVISTSRYLPRRTRSRHSVRVT